MNFKSIFLLLLVFQSSLVFGEPNVLKCNKNCGVSDLNDNYSFQARIAMGPDMWGEMLHSLRMILFCHRGIF